MAQKRGLHGGLSYLLLPFSFAYFLLLLIYKWSFKCNIRKIHNFNARILSVGNLTVGGTGKTPFVIFLAKLLEKSGKRVAIVTHGYRRKKRDNLIDVSSVEDKFGIGDEPWMISESVKVPLVIARKKTEGCRYAVEKYGPEFVILDDGFQSLQIARDLNVLLLDTTDSVVDDFLLPAGRFREPVQAVRRADIIVFTRCDQVSDERLKTYIRGLRRLIHNKPIFRSIHRPLYFKRFSDEKIVELNELRGKKLLACCSIGNSTSFLRTLVMLGCSLEQSLCFLDHHRYTQRDISRIKKISFAKKVDALVTTQKDIYSLRNYALEFDFPVYSLCIEIQMEYEQEFETLLRKRGII